MFNKFKQASAVLPPHSGKNPLLIDLGIPLQFQFCVTAGASAAADFFGNLSDCNLHEHIAFALHSFSVSVGAGLAATDEYSPATMQRCSDAFAAGYLGRLQQELRMFHGEGAPCVRQRSTTSLQ